MNHNFYTAVEIASTLKISKALAYRLIAKGDIRSVRFGRTVRVRQEDLDAFLSSKLSSTNTQVTLETSRSVNSQ